MINNLNKLGMERDFVSMTQSIYKKSTASILFYGEIFQVFPPRLGMKQECLLSLLLFNTVTKGYGQCNEARKRNKMYKVWKGRKQ